MATFAEHKKILKFIETFKPQLEKLVEASGKKRGIDTYKRGRRGESGVRSLGIDRGILIGKGGAGRLSRSIRSKRFGSLSAKIYTDVPYARIHNDGLMGKAWGKHSFKMPKRQFIGYSGKLNRQIIAFLDKNIKKQFNK